jgi:hypothetical protein
MVLCLANACGNVTFERDPAKATDGSRQADTTAPTARDSLATGSEPGPENALPVGDAPVEVTAAVQPDAADVTVVVGDAGPDAPALAPDGVNPDAAVLREDTVSDVAADGPDAPALVRDTSVPDGAIISKDVGADGSTAQQEAAADRAGKDTVVDGGGSPVCNGLLAFGGSLPVTANSTGVTSQSIPGYLALGDLNNDGKLDVVSANYWVATVSTLLGKGDGTFTQTGEYQTGAPRSGDGTLYAGPSAVVLGDLDGDGRLDLVTANNLGNTVSVLRGKGDGTFAAKVDYACGKGTQSVALADVNGDGRLDLVAANYESDTVSVLVGNGDGTLAAKVDYPVGDGPRKVALGDLDADGKLDIVAVNMLARTVSVLLGLGDGTFTDGMTSPTAGPPSAWLDEAALGDLAALGDVNGDGKPDLIVVTSQVSVMLGRGDGSFATPVGYPADYWGDGIRSLALADVNGDGKPDIFAMSSTGGPVSVLLGRGDGTFAAKADYLVGSGMNVVALGDVNGDGSLDIVVGIDGGGMGLIGASLGAGDGTFVAVANPYYATAASVAQVVLGDVNGDGKPDLVSVGHESSAGEVSVLLGTGGGAFADAVASPVGDLAAGVVLGDLDGDGRLDLVTANLGETTVSVLLGTGGGAFGPKVDYDVGNFSPGWVGLADFTGDRRLDIVAAGTYLGGGPDNVKVLVGTGGGKFTSRAAFQAGFFLGASAIGDLNRDGKPDLVLGGGYGSVGVCLGKGDGTFAAEVDYQVDYPSGSALNALALGDLNGDGNLDVVVGGPGLAVFLGKGNGTLTAPSGYLPFSGTGPLALGDLDKDGKLDVAARGGVAGLGVFLGRGDGTFAPELDYYFGMVALGDLDGDGRLDLVGASGDRDINLAFNLCP